MTFKQLISPTYWFQGVIMSKVFGKFAKWITGAVIGFITGPLFVKIVDPVLLQIGITIDIDKFREGATILLIGVFGALWNYVDHRFIKPAV